MTALCAVSGCPKPARLREWCGMHHQRWVRHGNPLTVLQEHITHGTSSERFLLRVEIDEGGCWLWRGTQNGQGYGLFCVDGGRQLAHRWSYEQRYGKIPSGLVLDHKCQTRVCANPDHLEPVTRRENIKRGWFSLFEKEKEE